MLRSQFAVFGWMPVSGGNGIESRKTISHRQSFVATKRTTGIEGGAGEDQGLPFMIRAFIALPPYFRCRRGGYIARCEFAVPGRMPFLHHIRKRAGQ